MGSGSDDEASVSAIRSRTPGEDPEDPYEDVDISELPDWWREAIGTFEEHGLRPYRPPRFEDGVLKHEVVDGLEREYGIDIRFISFDPTLDGDWEVRIDGEPVATIGRHRSPEGYTVFETDSEAFVALVESHV